LIEPIFGKGRKATRQMVQAQQKSQTELLL